jgi:DNA repair exonuclease SbcCD ATPase subunit
MKNIQLKELNLINFKGILRQKIKFDKNTNIFGDNGTGKTTIFDAFTWLLFGKDSTDRKDFEIKTLDTNNTVIPKIEHEVSAIIYVEEEEIIIKKI